ncbi:MAG: 50S ribosomal protein L30 [Acidobacteriia bacterium]|nr:50S ribosomal protein L30 [Terriglobia bacterium]
MTEKAQRTILIKWVRSGIGFTRRQKAMVRSLGLRRLNQVVERVDSPQVRGLVARIPHLVEIVDEAPRPPGWASVAEYALLPKEVVAPQPAVEPTSVAAAQGDAGAAQPGAETAPEANAKSAEEVAKPARKGKRGKTGGAPEESVEPPKTD